MRFATLLLPFIYSLYAFGEAQVVKLGVDVTNSDNIARRLIGRECFPGVSNYSILGGPISLTRPVCLDTGCTDCNRTSLYYTIQYIPSFLPTLLPKLQLTTLERFLVQYVSPAWWNVRRPEPLRSSARKSANSG